MFSILLYVKSVHFDNDRVIHCLVIALTCRMTSRKLICIYKSPEYVNVETRFDNRWCMFHRIYMIGFEPYFWKGLFYNFSRGRGEEKRISFSEAGLGV